MTASFGWTLIVLVAILEYGTTSPAPSSDEGIVVVTYICFLLHNILNYYLNADM